MNDCPNLTKKCRAPLYNLDLDDAIQEMARRRNELKIIVTTGLGSDVDRYASQSPTLVKQITQLKGKKWKIIWGSAGKGSQKILEDEERNIVKLILIDSQFNTKKPKDIAYVTSTVAHEVGMYFFIKRPIYLLMKNVWKV